MCFLYDKLLFFFSFVKKLVLKGVKLICYETVDAVLKSFPKCLWQSNNSVGKEGVSLDCVFILKLFVR